MESKMKLVLWGSGQRAQRFVQFFGAGCVVAVIESDLEKIATSFSGKPIIDFDTYKRNYLELPIVVTPDGKESILDILNKNDITHYMTLEDCPCEIWFTNGKKTVLEERIRGLSAESTYLIYGLTIFSWYLYIRLQKAGIEVYLLPDNTNSTSLVRIIEYQLHTQFMTNVDEVQSKYIDYIIWSSAERNLNLKNRFSNGKMIEMYDLLPIYSNYWCHELLKFRNIHKGKRCFIVANGPSLKYEDLELLHRHREITFAVNRGYMAFPYTKWRPDYYAVVDTPAFMQFRNELLSNVKCDRFFPSNTEEFWKGVSDEKIHRLYIACAKDANNNLKFSDDIVKGCYIGWTIVYVCIQIAVYMGFTQIYLIGADCSYTGLPQSDGNHFYKEENQDTVKAAAVRYEAMIQGYQSAKRYADHHGIGIYNATHGGQLEVFERVDFDSLFKKCDMRFI